MRYRLREYAVWLTGYDRNGTEFFINGASFAPPSVPVLLQILSGNLTAQSLLPPGSVYTLPLNSVIKVSIPGGLFDEEHPFHLYGVGFLYRMARVSSC